jgi:hypothetical protein
LESQNNALYTSQATEEVLTRSKTFGQDVAAAVWNYSKTDIVGHDAYLDPFKDYDWNAHYDSPGDWVPTNPGPGKPMFGNWGKVRTFAINEADKLCPPPIPYSEATNSYFFNQAMEVYANTVNATYENVWIAEFWSDDLEGFTITPAGRWISIVNQVIEKAHPSISTTLETYLKSSISLCDVAVHCWAIKYRYNIERPQEYIRRVIDPNWSPLHGNPSFPAYPSGHACFGAAVAMVLADAFGDQFTMEDKTHQNRPEFDSAPRTFYSFSDMARENALSRIVGGVHYRMDCEEGLRLGKIIGQKIASIPLHKSQLSLQVSKQGN